MGFLAELLQETLHKQGITEDPAVAKGLWNVLVIGKFASRQTIAGFFTARWVAAASGLAGRLVNRFSVKRSRTSAGMEVEVFAVALVAGVGVGAQLLVEEAGRLWLEAWLLIFSVSVNF